MNPVQPEPKSEPPSLPHRPGLAPDEVESPGDPGPNIIVPPPREDPRTDDLPPQVEPPAPGI